jgi:hypothetical protein
MDTQTFLRTTAVFALLLLGIGSPAEAQVSIRIRIGPPPPPRVARVQPPSPGRNLVWIVGYWYPVGHHYKWHKGCWTRPPYEGARWIAPRYDRDRFYPGYGMAIGAGWRTTTDGTVNETETSAILMTVDGRDDDELAVVPRLDQGSWP